MCACVVEKMEKASHPEHTGFVLEQEECALPMRWRKGQGAQPGFPLLLSDIFIDFSPLFFLSNYPNLKSFANMP